MADHQVRCINKTPRNDPYHGITHVGGAGWKLRRDEVANLITSKVHTFYTMVNGKRADVGVRDNGNGPFLQTYSDGKWDNNLLSLPECIGY